MKLLVEKQPGDRVGPYRIKCVLGQGGQGIVYHAIRTIGKRRHVAIKHCPIVTRAFQTEGTCLARLQHEREAHVMATLSQRRHGTHVPRLLETFRTEREFFLVMSLVRGESVSKYEALTVGSVPFLKTLACDALTALKIVHSYKITHNDLKPSNFLYDQARHRLTLIDFGVATNEEDRQCASPNPQGTPTYMAPEVADAGVRAASPRSDLFGLGIMLYELYTGEHPYRRDPCTAQHRSASRILQILREGETEWLSGVVEHELASSPKHVRSFLLRLLNPDPDKRYATAHLALQDTLRL